MVLPFLTIFLTKSLGFSLIEAGLATSVFGIGSLAGSWLGGWLSDRIGTYRVIFWSLVLSAFGFWALIFVKTFYPFCLVIFIASTFAESFRPATLAAIADYSTKENQTRAISLIRLAINLGIAIGPAIGGLVAGLFGYHWLFILDGLTCLLAAIFLIFALKPKASQSKKEETAPQKIKSAYLDYVFILFMFICLINDIAFMQILSTIPLYFKEVYTLTESQIGLFFTVNGLLIFLVEMPIIYLLEKRFKSMEPVIWGALLMGIGHLAFVVLPIGWAAIILYTLLISFGEIINFPFTTSISIERSNESQRGQYMGLMTMMFSLTFILAPIIGTSIVDRFGFNNLWISMGLINILAFGLYIAIRKPLEKPGNSIEA